MNIQTAGQQKYYDFIEERAKKLRTGMIVWGSLLAVAFIGMFSDAGIAAVLALIGGAYAMVNIKAQRALKGKLDVVADPEEFFRQLADPDLTECKNCRLIITKDYVLSKDDDIFIYPLSEIEKVEVKSQKKDRKALLLIDREGRSHTITSCAGEAGMQEEFDLAYRVLSERV
ncbi:MAG: hypothetical protein K1W22_06830 [Lachnospiraceae bacterium]